MLQGDIGSEAARPMRQGWDGPFVTPKVATSDGPQLLTNPAWDDAFRRDAEAALLTARTPAALQAALRDHYRLAAVRMRELSSETVEVWYVYRDGHWVSSENRHKTWVGS